MEQIIKFRAIDGKEFSDEWQCVKYEQLYEKVDDIMSLLPPKPNNDNCNFANGEGFFQHNKATLRKVEIQILELCKVYIDHDWIQSAIDGEKVHPSNIARLLGDYNIKPIDNAWGRFMCIDKYSREWGQPYYANNPEEGKQVSIA